MPNQHSGIDVVLNAAGTVEDAASSESPSMADFQPFVKSFYGPSVVAYPSSLEVFDVDGGMWYWNASCWLAYRELDIVETNQISFYIEQQLGYEWKAATGYAMLHLGTDRDDCDDQTPEFSTFIVFPKADKSNAYRGGFRDCSEDFMREWTDEVMIPALKAVFGRDGGRMAGVGSYELIKLNSQAARVRGMRKVPDTPISVSVRWDELKVLWANIQRIVAEKCLTEFQEMFLVIIAGEQDRGMRISAESLEEFWSRFSRRWSSHVNMKFVPVETVHIAAKSYYGLK